MDVRSWYWKNGQSFAGGVWFAQIFIGIATCYEISLPGAGLLQESGAVYLRVQAGVGLPLAGPRAN